MGRRFIGPLLALALASPISSRAVAQIAPETGQFHPEIERRFLDGMRSFQAGDYRRAEALFRRILDRDPRLLRVRLELARTLFMEKRDEQADYHFRLAAAAHPPAQVS